jgi:hypothetical protein
MGILFSDKAKGADERALEQARAAWDEGRSVFVAGLGGAVRADAPAVWTITVEAVEAIGWRLEHWAVNGTSAWPLFRRA